MGTGFWWRRAGLFSILLPPLKRFFRRLVWFTLAVHAVFGLAVGHLVGEGPWAWLAGALAAVALAGALWWRIRLLMDDRPISSVRRFFERLYFAHWGACILATAVFIPALLLAIVGVLSVGVVATASYSASFVVGAYAVFVRTRWVRVRTLEVPVARLPAAFDGYRIAQLSDIHIGSLFPASAIRRFVDAANRQGADMIALTGDYLTSGSRFHHEIAQLLTSFTSKDGTFAVWGNHDNYGDREPLTTLLREGGVKLLENASTTVEREGAVLTVVGVDDIFSRRADVEATFRGVAEDASVLALVHDPKQFPACAAKGAALVLTGHTHWGQIGLPLAPERVNLATRFFRFSAGLYHHEGSTLYVHPGIGSTGPPLRFGVPPEVTVLVLRAGSKAQPT